MRRSSSAFSASLTRTSRRSARSFTVMPSEKVMVRVIGGGAAGAGACCGRCSASRFCAGFIPDGRCCCCGRKPGRIGGWPGRCGMPVGRTHRLRRQRTRSAQHRRGVALRRTRLIRTDAGPAGARGCRWRPAADAAQRAARRAAAAARPGASVAAAARSAAPCRVLRRAGECSAARSGRTFRARPRAGSALAAAARFRRRRLGSAALRQPARAPLRRGGASRPAAARAPRPAAATASSGFGSAGFAFLIRRGGPSVGAAGFGGSGAGAAPFLPGAAFALAVLACLTACSENMSPFGRVMPFCLARRSTNWRATISSSVLDALLSSMPWFFFNSASTSLLVMSRSSATL